MSVDAKYEENQAVIIVYGDVDGNGEVNGKDRTILARYLDSWTGYDTINEANADVDSNGEVNGKDRTILARYLDSWTGYESLPYTK